jgi:hypothetical protein
MTRKSLMLILPFVLLSTVLVKADVLLAENRNQLPSAAESDKPITQNSNNTLSFDRIYYLPTVFGGGLIALTIFLLGFWLLRKK